MAKANHGKQLLNFVSHREFYGIRGSDLGNALIERYATNFGRRAGAQTDMRKLFEQIYGDKWYDEPYNKLHTLAKLAVPKNGPVKNWYSTPLDWHPATVKRIHEWQRHKAAFYDSYRYRVCKRYYKASAIDEFIEKRALWDEPATRYDSIEHLFDNLLVFVAYARKYDKTCLKMLKKADSVDKLHNLSNSTGYVRRYSYCADDLSALTEAQRNDFMKIMLNATLTDTLSEDAEEIAWARVTRELYERYGSRLGRLTAWCTGKNSYKHVVQARRECEKVREAKRICGKLGLSITEGERKNIPYTTWRLNKFNHKTYRMLKQLEKAYDSGVDEQSIETTANRLSRNIYASTYYYSSMYTPVLYGGKE